MARRQKPRMAELYALHVRGAVGLAYALTGDRQVAEDIAQDAFVRVFGRFGDLRATEAFGRYLRRTIVNMTRMYFRRKHVERVYVQWMGRESHSDTGFPDIEQRDFLWQRLLELPQRQRAALVLHYYEDLSEHQVAEVLDISGVAAKSLIARGMKSLREQVLEPTP